MRQRKIGVDRRSLFRRCEQPEPLQAVDRGDDVSKHLIGRAVHGRGKARRNLRYGTRPVAIVPDARGGRVQAVNGTVGAIENHDFAVDATGNEVGSAQRPHDGRQDGTRSQNVSNARGHRASRGRRPAESIAVWIETKVLRTAAFTRSNVLIVTPARPDGRPLSSS